MSKFEYRVGWSINMVGGNGTSEWEEWDGFEETADEVENAIYESTGGYDNSVAADVAVNCSGFEYWVEVREVEDDEDE